jgi:hypothetical protein
MVQLARSSEAVVGFGSSTLLVGAVVARLARRPFVYRSIGDPTAWARVKGSALRIGVPARSAARVVALYPAAAKAWQDLHGVSSDHLVTIPNGASTDRLMGPWDAVCAQAHRPLGLA